MPENTNDFGDDAATPSPQPQKKHEGMFGGFGDFITEKADDLGIGGAMSKGFDAVKDTAKSIVDDDKKIFNGFGDVIEAGHDKIEDASHAINDKVRDIPGVAGFEDSYTAMKGRAQEGLQDGFGSMMSRFGVDMPNSAQGVSSGNAVGGLGVESPAAATEFGADRMGLDAPSHNAEPDIEY